MIRALLHALLRRFERRFAYDAGYQHAILDASLTAFLKLAPLQALGARPRQLPPGAHFAARFAAVRAEDCGPCAQLAIDMARADGVEGSELRAVVDRDYAAMAVDTELALRFAEAVLDRAVPGELGQAVEQRFGARGRVALACAIVSARCYPVLKRALGQPDACARLRVDDAPGGAAPR